MSNIIKQLETEQLKQNVPSFRPGDTLEVKVWVVEGSKKRLQAFEGVVIAIRNRGLHSAFTLLNVKVQYVKLNFTTYVSVQVNLHVSKSVWVHNPSLNAEFKPWGNPRFFCAYPKGMFDAICAIFA